MRILLSLYFLFVFSMNVQAQHNHFVYIQTENKQVFSIRLNGNTLSSTASGYLIIPKLTAGLYKINIGFPKNEWPAQTLDIPVNDKDQGFILKNFGEKGWGLFNTQTMAVVMGSKDGPENIAASNPNNTNGFSNTLAEVTNTPVTQPDNMVKSTPLRDSSARVAEVAMKENVNAAEVVIPTIIKEDKTVPAPVKPAQLFSLLDSTGRSAVYLSETDGKEDTVRIFIPYVKKIVEAIEGMEIPTKEPGPKSKPLDDTTIMAIMIDSSKAVAKRETVITSEETALITDIKVSDVNKAPAGNYTVTIINPACKSMADDDDF